MDVQSYLIIGLTVWVLLLTAGGVWIMIYFHRLSEGVHKQNLIKILEGVLAKQKEVLKSFEVTKKIVKDIENEGRLHIQKTAAVRFNPFNEMGGDHSFSLALLDKYDTGYIITGLHTRERTRVYLKNILKGKCELELSNEEQKALKLAMKK